MKIIAWHSSHDYMREVFEQRGDIPSITLDDTHFKVPVELHLENTVPNEVALRAAFNFFNWVQSDFDAPKEVNALCAEKGTHASMSVGDLVQLPDGSYWFCAIVGWVRVTDITRIITEQERADELW